jgi:DNA-binding MarR family transcriptional regulator
MESAAVHVGIHLLRLLLLCREVDKELAKRSGLGIDELHCLCVLHLDRPSCVKYLNSSLGLYATRTSKLLRSLEELGMVTRSLQFEDHRKEQITLTEKGRLAAESILDFCAEHGSELVRGQFPEIIASLESAVRKESTRGPVDSCS